MTVKGKQSNALLNKLTDIWASIWRESKRMYRGLYLKLESYGLTTLSFPRKRPFILTPLGSAA